MDIQCINQTKINIIYQKQKCKKKLIALLGGRAAEKLVLNDISTGASNDIEVATKLQEIW